MLTETATAVVPSTAVSVREATLEDVEALVVMGQRFRNESIYATRLPENTAQMAQIARQLITADEGHVLVAERGGLIVGTIGLVLFPHHFSGNLTVAELFFWVNPEHRGYGVRLLRRGEQWARDRGATTMQMIAPTAEVGQFYARLGYTALEVAYEKEIGPCL